MIFEMRCIAALLGGTVVSIGLVAAVPPVMAQGAEFTPEQERVVRELVLKTIREQPDIVLEALKILETRQKAAQAGSVQRTLAEKADALFRHKDDPVGGNPKGDVTLVEFFDYRCSFCKRVHPTIQRLLKEDGNIRYVYKEFPILGPSSLFAARAALAAFSLGKYARFSKAMMESRGALNKARVFALARKSGLDPLKLEKEMQAKDAQIKAAIQRNYELAQGLDINVN
jgi:protein-disulfide isomerase